MGGDATARALRCPGVRAWPCGAVDGVRGARQDARMTADSSPLRPSPTALQPEEQELVARIEAALQAQDGERPRACLFSLAQQRENLDRFADLLARYPSPLEEQVLDGRRRGLDTLVEAGVDDLRITNVDCTPNIVGDINGDGSVNGSDLSILLGSWGSNNPAADLDRDGVVGGTDLATLMSNWR